jgi:Tol biopolymer transport system component
MLRKITGIAAAAILAAIGGWAIAQIQQSKSSPIKSVAYRLSEYQHFNGSGLQILAISRDGSKIAFAATNGLYLCSADSPAPALIPGTQGITAQPFFAPDGKWIGYWSLSDGLLKKVAVGGGIPVLLRGLNFVMGAHWHEDNSIAFGMATGGILQIPTTKGSVSSLVPAGTEKSVDPQILPGGSSILYTAIVSNKAYIAVKSLKTIGERKLLFEGSAGWYLPSGHIIYRSLGNLVSAVSFDSNKLEVTGVPIHLFPGILSRERAAQFAVSEMGALAYIPEFTVKPGYRSLVWITRNGKEEPASAPTDAYTFHRISPDGKHVALTVSAGGKRDICVWDIAHATMTRITSNDADDSATLWSPDSQRIIYLTASGESGFDINAKAADGSSAAQKLGSIPNRNFLIYWLKDGRELTMKPFQGLSGEELPQISPDGRWLAYASNESGQNEVYVRPFPNVTQGKWMVSAQGGTSPLWSPDGRELFYRDAEAVIAVPVEAGMLFKTGRPAALFWNPDFAIAAGQPSSSVWDISPVDKRFLMSKLDLPVRKVVLLTNWLDLLKQSR